jgi:hypothetical protein
MVMICGKGQEYHRAPPACVSNKNNEDGLRRRFIGDDTLIFTRESVEHAAIFAAVQVSTL